MAERGNSLLIVDDHSMFSESLRTMILKHLPEIQGIEMASSSSEALAKLRHNSYTLVLLDIRLAHEERSDTEYNAGLNLCALISERFPQSKVLILSAYNENYFVQQAKLLGARGYLCKDLPVKTLIVGIRRVLGGGEFFDEVSIDSFELREIEKQISYLHPRIIKMLLLFWEGGGLSNQELATKMGLREKTIRNYMSQVYDQLDIHSRSRLMLWLQNYQVYLKNAFEKGKQG